MTSSGHDLINHFTYLSTRLNPRPHTLFRHLRPRMVEGCQPPSHLASNWARASGQRPNDSLGLPSWMVPELTILGHTLTPPGQLKLKNITFCVRDGFSRITLKLITIRITYDDTIVFHSWRRIDTHTHTHTHTPESAVMLFYPKVCRILTCDLRGGEGEELDPALPRFFVYTFRSATYIDAKNDTPLHISITYLHTD